MKRILAVITLGVLVAGGSQAAEEALTLPIQRLQMDVALQMAQTALEACRKEGVSVAVTVVDRGGHVQVALRDTLAMPITVPVSKGKAYAALNFNAPTGEVAERFTTPFGPPKLEGLIVSAGGLPITAGSTILGGIGISGAPSGETDEMCAQAGIDAISADLEMSL